MFPLWSRHTLYQGEHSILFSVLLTMASPGLVAVIIIILCCTIPICLYFLKQVMIIHSLVLYNLCWCHLYIAVWSSASYFSNFLLYQQEKKRIIGLLWDFSRIICAQCLACNKCSINVSCWYLYCFIILL